jgi:hypothetical protein
MMVDDRTFLIGVIVILAVVFGGIGMGLGAWLF